ncbi:flagellar basal body L-ring protein FlgH [Anaeroselena agilis]|uniref:Flagellar basal body L-ring protein FlgH n=1 Tax=Anaeroselena agilis TaxID=3063788 RepID=A0ABU3P419_9FIRM|nr:flagellar basal body L-ring protein FlgH [Selenomonadales bacterium 4137-cl]
MSNIYIKAIILSVVLASALLAPLQPPAEAASLWSEQNSLFGDRKARAVGDSLTIIISESSVASRTGNAANSKSASTKATAGTGVFKWIDNAGTSGSDSFKAEGKITNSNSVTGRITVQVTGVKPNGNLEVSGTQSIKQNGEEQKITITGEVRPEDVSVDNSVMSYNVANAQLKIDGKGPIANKQRQGILTQIFNFLF